MLSLDKQNELREQFRQKRPGWRPATEVYADLVRSYLRPSSRVLDVGCGRGGLVEQLDHPLAQVVGIDPDWASLREHRLDLPRVAGLSDDLPFAPASFDVAFASWVLEHLERPLRTFCAMYRVLKPGGVFVFITPNGRHPLAWANRGLGRFSRLQGRLVAQLYGRQPDDTFPTYYRANTAVALEELCAASGLVLDNLHTIPDPTYLAFNKPVFHLMGWFEIHLPSAYRLHLVGVCRKEIR
ncbi:MAG TPA: class I SAM-dependent methyltransferase [Anaerolineae bacterium]|nr:class I SAM-dependent methyltransferase [Anaerolineae bacterium]